jgi:hypothetical protein
MGMQLTVSKMVALAIATAYVTAGFALGNSWAFALTVAGGALLPLALIWFPEYLGGLTGWGTRFPVDRPSPPQLLAWMGWLLLLGMPVVVFFLASNRR